jgi:hypothetical protein
VLPLPGLGEFGFSPLLFDHLLEREREIITYSKGIITKTSYILI